MNWTQALGLTLLHFLWQGLIIGLLAAAIIKVLKTAHARYLAACGAMTLMGLIALATFLWIAQPLELTVAPSTPTLQIMTSYVAPQAVQLAQSWTARLLPWLDLFWFAGVCALAIRSARSWFAAMRLKHSGITDAPGEWQDRAQRLMQRLAISQPVRLCESALAQVPSVIGWLKPVILIPVGTLAGLSPEQLETILAHELAHIRRHDYLINLLQTAIETLLFYHPAIWWLGGRIRSEREHCCDDLAVAVCGDVFLYARALANLEQLRHAGPRLALAATDGGLLSRISRLLGHGAPPKDSSSYWLPTLLMLMLAAAGMVAQQRTPPPAPPTPPAPIAAPEPPSAPEAPEAPEPPPQPPTKPDFIDNMDRAGLKNLTVDQLIALKIHEVTPEYIQQTKAMGFDLNIDQLTAFRIHGVTPEYMNDWKSRGWNLTSDQLIAFRIHDVTAQSLDQMKAMGFNLTPDNAIAANIHQITPAWVKTWKDAGFKDIQFDQLVALKIHDASPATLKDLAALGFPNPTIDQIMQARIFDITPAFVDAVRKHAFKDLTFEQVVRLKQMEIIH